MKTKQSKAAMIRLIESGLYEAGNLRRDQFYILVNGVVVSGSPPTHISAAVLVRFLPGGAPFCCGEPECYTTVFSERTELGDYLRRKMKLRHTVTIDLTVWAEYFDGIVFTKLSGA